MRSIYLAIVSAALACGLVSAAEARTRVGILKCYMDGGFGYIVGSSHDARCVFEGADGRREDYDGRMKRIGLDVGYTGKSVVVWAVFAPSDYRGGRALRGSYVGASADIAVGVGGGGNILIGGNNRTIELQPFSIKGETGIAVALGAGDLELR